MRGTVRFARCLRTLDEFTNDSPAQAPGFWKHIKSEVSMLGPLKRKVTIQDADDKGSTYTSTLYRTLDSVGGSLVKAAKAIMTPTDPTKENVRKLLVAICKKATHISWTLDSKYIFGVAASPRQRHETMPFTIRTATSSRTNVQLCPSPWSSPSKRLKASSCILSTAEVADALVPSCR
jgi:hypothetical protein